MSAPEPKQASCRELRAGLLRFFVALGRRRACPVQRTDVLGRLTGHGAPRAFTSSTTLESGAGNALELLGHARRMRVHRRVLREIRHMRRDAVLLDRHGGAREVLVACAAAGRSHEVVLGVTTGSAAVPVAWATTTGKV